MAQPKRTSHEVSPAILSNKLNVLQQPLTVVACWRLEPQAFGFDHRFIEPWVRDRFVELAGMFRDYPGCPVTLFGHADPTGDELYNQRLAYERALAVFGVITFDTRIWIDLFDRHIEDRKYLHRRLAEQGFTSSDPPGVIGPSTASALRGYFEFLLDASSFVPPVFLDVGRPSMQGCSSFNPLLVFSRAMADRLDPVTRDAYNAANRRVLLVFFAPGTVVQAGNWPCPVPSEGVRKCKKRFWSDASRRRLPGSKSRIFRAVGTESPVPAKFVAAEDTFACRFYDRIVHELPCERVLPKPPELPNDDRLVLQCGHNPHGRFNGGALGFVGPDVLQVVPRDGPDAITVSFGRLLDAETGPNVVLSKARGLTLFVNGAPHALGEPTTTLEAPEMVWDGLPWDLYFEWKDRIGNPISLMLEHAGVTHRATIGILPSRTFELDPGPLLRRIQDYFRTATKVWEFLGELIIEELDLDVLPREGTVLEASMEWREFPVTQDGRFHLAFMYFRLLLQAEPILAAHAVGKFGLIDLLKKVPVLGEKILSRIPRRIRDKLGALALQLTMDASIGGTIFVERDDPFTKPVIGPRQGQQSSAASGTLKWFGALVLSIKDLLGDDDLPDMDVGVELGIEGTLQFGPVLDLDEKTFGFYLTVGELTGSIAITFSDIDLPGELFDISSDRVEEEFVIAERGEPHILELDLDEYLN